jgi:hypothetical protein
MNKTLNLIKDIILKLPDRQTDRQGGGTMNEPLKISNGLWFINYIYENGTSEGYVIKELTDTTGTQLVKELDTNKGSVVVIRNMVKLS